jgi:hypothetical protein
MNKKISLVSMAESVNKIITVDYDKYGNTCLWVEQKENDNKARRRIIGVFKEGETIEETFKYISCLYYRGQMYYIYDGGWVEDESERERKYKEILKRFLITKNTLEAMESWH